MEAEKFHVCELETQKSQTSMGSSPSPKIWEPGVSNTEDHYLSSSS